MRSLALLVFLGCAAVAQAQSPKTFTPATPPRPDEETILNARVVSVDVPGSRLTVRGVDVKADGGRDETFMVAATAARRLAELRRGMEVLLMLRGTTVIDVRVSVASGGEGGNVIRGRAPGTTRVAPRTAVTPQPVVAPIPGTVPAAGAVPAVSPQPGVVPPPSPGAAVAVAPGTVVLVGSPVPGVVVTGAPGAAPVGVIFIAPPSPVPQGTPFPTPLPVATPVPVGTPPPVGTPAPVLVPAAPSPTPTPSPTT